LLKDGFKNSKIYVIPMHIVNDLKKNSLTKALHFSDIGLFTHALYHYRERINGSDQYILIYCIDGEGFVKFNGIKKTVSKDSLVIIPKNTPHCYGSVFKKPWTILWVHFLGEASDSFANLYKNNNILKIQTEKKAKIIALFDEIFLLLDKGITLEALAFSSLILGNIMGIFLLNNQITSDITSSRNKINESILFMANNLDKNFSLNELSEKIGFSKTHYTSLFREATGVSPIDYFIRLKIQKSCQYLDMTDLKIIQIATQLGFADPYYFSRAFKKIMGVSPINYKKIKKG